LGVFFQLVGGNNVAIAQNYANGAYPLNTPSTPTRPNDVEIVWTTGLGGINGPDNVLPGMIVPPLPGAPPGNMLGTVTVTVTVGGVPIPPQNITYAGRQAQSAAVDNVYFIVPQGVPYGCQVPVTIAAGGVTANVANIAITADGAPCQ
jgi:uncharacterized protein (TIGR03437 family)